MNRNKNMNRNRNNIGKSVCPLENKEQQINYKNVKLLNDFITSRGRILPKSKTGVSCARQRLLVKAIKRARYMAFLPYVQYV